MLEILGGSNIDKFEDLKKEVANIARLKLNKTVIENAKKLASQGNYNCTIAAALRISEQTFYNWLKQGKADSEGGVSSLFREFYEALEEAESAAEVEAIRGILEAGKKQWQALAWFLERRHPDKWGLKKRSDDSDDSDEKLKELVEAIRNAASV